MLKYSIFMSTSLENTGVSLNSKLWTAKILAEQPDLIKQVHKNYFRAGADCGITCSYQASIPGLTENGYSLEEAENLIRNAVKIFCEAREEWWEEEGREAGRQWRVSEKKLIGLALIGGSVGAFIGMIVFHHKVRKWYFKLGIPAILATQLTITIHFILK